VCKHGGCRGCGCSAGKRKESTESKDGGLHFGSVQWGK
jgi:hypothetical protein